VNEKPNKVASGPKGTFKKQGVTKKKGKSKGFTELEGLEHVLPCN